MPAIDSKIQKPLSPLVWLPIPLLAVAIIACRAAGLREIYPFENLRLVLSFIFYTLVSLGTIFLIGRSFLAAGTLDFLLLECGVILWCLAGTAGDIFDHGDANVNVTIFNTAILLSGLCHLAGVIFSLRPQRALSAPPLWLAAGGALTMGALGLIIQAALSKWLPVFFIQGEGGTPVRQFVLLAALAMFALSAGLLLSSKRAARTPFSAWYAPALLLLALGLFGILVQFSLFSVVNWLARTAQWMGGFYLLLAAIAALRESHLPLFPKEEKESFAARHRYGVAIAIVLAAAAIRMALLQPLGQRALFVSFYPAVLLAALYGGLRAGFLATVLSAAMVDYFWMKPVGQFSIEDPGDLLALVIFFFSSLLVCWVIEVMHRARIRAAAAEERAKFAAERQRVEEALRQSEAVKAERQRFLDVLETLPVVVTLLRPDHRVEWLNRAYREALGDNVGQLCFSSQFKRDKPCEECQAFTPLKTGRPHNWEWTLPDGRTFDIYNYPFTDTDGSPLILEMDIDITERRKAEAVLKDINTTLEQRVAERTAALSESESRLKLALRSANMGTWQFDLRENKRRFDGQVCRCLGLDPAAFGGTAEEFYAAVHPDDREGIQNALARAINTGAPYEAEYRAVWPDGMVHHIASRGQLARGADGRPERIDGLVWDITERKLAEEALVQAKAAAEEANRQKDHFLAVLGHELRNPLAPIRNAVALLKRTGPPDPMLQRANELIDRQTAHMTRLIDDLLDVSRIERGKIVLQKNEFDLTETVQVAVEDHRPLVEANGVSLSFAVPAQPLCAFGDSARIAQIVTNLVMNANKFTDRGGKITVTLAAEGEHQAVITFRDTGIGMDAETLETLFKPFAQADRSLARARGGLGLGLALVKGLVELHGGTVKAQSSGLGKGSEFAVVLPILISKPAQAEAPVSSSAPKARSKRILIVEDNRDAAESLEMLLKMNGHLVAVAYAGAEGLQKAKALKPEAVLCDIGLPDGMNGYEVAKAIRSDPDLRSAYLVAMTGYGQDEDKKRAIDAGFDSHLTKPADPAALERLLAR